MAAYSALLQAALRSGLCPLGAPNAEAVNERPRRQRTDKPLWAQVAVGATHCAAGCTLGHLIAEWAVFAAGHQLLGLALPAEYLLDYALALGILFQFFAIAPMRHPVGHVVDPDVDA